MVTGSPAVASPDALPGASLPTEGWHAVAPSDALDRLGSSLEGLDAEEAARRLARFGPNSLAPPKRVSALRILLDQFASVVVGLLVVASVLALFVGDLLEAAAIGVVLVINTVVGFVVEVRARRAMEGLLRFQVPVSRVVRAGQVSEVPANRLVPGDVVEVESGDAVPADARIVSAAELRADEAALTGESAPVDKGTAPVEPAATLAERASMLYTGTTVTMGRARAVVVATGRGTELGRIGTLLEKIREGPTPLERRLDALGHRLIWLALGVTGVVVAAGSLRGAPLRTMIETGVALAIAAIPEGLPAVATIALAVGMHRMARRRALVREPDAVEALGAATVVCTDKTGTLTANQMTVTRLVGADYDVRVSGVGFFTDGEILRDGRPVDTEEDPHLGALLEAAALTSRATVDRERAEVTGDRTDAALLVLALKARRDPEALAESLPLVVEIPFSSTTGLSASAHRDGSAVRCLVKGSPPAVLERCSRVGLRSGPVTLDADRRRDLEEANESLAGHGYRVIALAEGSGAPEHADDVRDLTFLGFAAIIDPPAEGVRETIRLLHEAGIRTIMITGDQRDTAKSIAVDLALMDGDDDVVDGRALAAMDDASLAESVDRVKAYSRVSPEDKLRIVSTLQEKGETVAMLGDGVNDAAALKQADVGVVMGIRGTDVAKETAAVVLQDDRFATIAAAVEEGRVIHDNIRKFVFYLFGCNLAEVLVLLVSGLAALPLPLLPLQVLWLNLVTDTFPALALALEPGEKDVMRRPPRDPEAAILSWPFVKALAFYASLITAVTMTAYLLALGSGRPEAAVTVSFMTLALAQLFHLGNARSRLPVLSPSAILANRWAVAAVPVVVGLQLLATYWPPLRRVLGTVPLSPGELGLALALALVPAVVGQLVQWAQNRAATATSGAP